MRTAKLDGAVEGGGSVELEVALKSLGQFSGTRGRGPLAGTALWGVGRLNEAVPNGRRGATEVQLAAVGVVVPVLASRGEHVGHEAGHDVRLWRVDEAGVGDGEGALDAPGMRKSGGRPKRPVELKGREPQRQGLTGRFPRARQRDDSLSLLGTGNGSE